MFPLAARFCLIFLTVLLAYFGTQGQADILWNVFYDVQLGFSASRRICEQADNSRTSLSLKAALVF